MASTAPTPSTSSNAECFYRSSADAAAAARELQSLTSTPSLVELQTSLIQRYVATRPNEQNAAFQAAGGGRMNLHDVIQFALGVVAEDDFDS
ncbi:expressed unknown protein [Seminavis robusta]|uniref:Uncharacterized protein n=1 Tax=Seminavis robusta TaxID=568900 RepID=A0A9N8DJJ4_9STRA|nr:expressed unknown protein [Seminavis robusta]|eukprot:Sro163_g073100.1 n/a (92) ;mRNA; r:22283-22558